MIKRKIKRKNPRDEELLKQLIIKKKKFGNNIMYEALIYDDIDTDELIHVGYAEFNPDKIWIDNVEIDKLFKRKGVATYLYDYIEKDQNVKLKPSNSLFPAGKKFWINRLKQRKNPIKNMKQNPFPNEHAARQTEPDPKIYKTYRRSSSGLPDGISIIYGIRRVKGPRGGRSEIQSIRFNKNLWSPAKAKTWLKKHKFKVSKFTPAKSKVRKNPHKSLEFYVEKFKRNDIYLPNEIDEEDKLIISRLWEKGFRHCEKVGKYENAEIYLCYLGLNARKYLYAIIEFWPNHIEYHTFDNNIKEIEKNINTYDKRRVLNKLSLELFEYYINNI